MAKLKVKSQFLSPVAVSPVRFKWKECTSLYKLNYRREALLMTCDLLHFGTKEILLRYAETSYYTNIQQSIIANAFRSYGKGSKQPNFCIYCRLNK